jgi:hypothetical protein
LEKRSALLSLTLVSVGSWMFQTARAQTLPDPSVNRATDGIISAFQSHPLVGLGDWHGLAQEEDFFSELIRDPRFARDVGNVVVEFGGAAQQSTLDRYEAGEDIPYDQLRRSGLKRSVGFPPSHWWDTWISSRRSVLST